MGADKTAFQVQWKASSLQDTQVCQNQFQHASVQGCWLFKRLPPHQTSPDLPLFALTLSAENNFEVELEYKRYPLTDFVIAYVSKQIRFCSQITVCQRQSIRLVFFAMTCWRCGETSHVYYVDNPSSACGLELNVDNDAYRFAPEILIAVRAFLQSDTGKALKLGAIKERYSKTMGCSYLSFGCHACDAILGNHFVIEQSLEVRYKEDQAPAILEQDIVLQESVSHPAPHWCYSKQGDFCCSAGLPDKSSMASFL